MAYRESNVTMTSRDPERVVTPITLRAQYRENSCRCYSA